MTQKAAYGGYPVSHLIEVDTFSACPFHDKYDGYCGLKRVKGYEAHKQICPDTTFLGYSMSDDCPLWNSDNGTWDTIIVKVKEGNKQQ